MPNNETRYTEFMIENPLAAQAFNTLLNKRGLKVITQVDTRCRTSFAVATKDLQEIVSEPWNFSENSVHE